MDYTAQAKPKLGLEKQEHLVKLAILTIAAILCKQKLVTYNYKAVFDIFIDY